MTDEKEKKPSLFSKLWSKTKSGGAVAVAGAGVAGMAVGGMVVGGARLGVGLFRLAGRFTFLFVLLAAALHYFHITRAVAQPSFFDPFLIMYIFLGVFASVFFWADPNDPFPVKRTVKFILLALVAYIVPFILQQLVFYGFLDQRIAAFFVIFTPVLVIYAFMDPGDGLTRLVGTAYFLFIVILALVQIVFPMLQQTNISGPMTVLFTPAQVIDSIRDAGSTLRDQAQQTTTTVTTQVRNGTQRVTQEIYTGQVDQSQGLPLGIQIIDARSLFQNFRLDTGDDVIATASIRARTINNDEYTIVNNCYLEFTVPSSSSITGGKVRATGTVTPETFTIGYTGEQYDVRYIECIVSNASIQAAAGINAVNVVSGQVVFNTTFNFVTSSYMTHAFMDRNLFSSLRSDNREPWREMGLQGPTMMAKYTPGPVMIGMPAETTPYPIDGAATTASLPAFGATFSNAFIGRGGIESFDSTYVYIPRLLRFGSACTPRDFTITRSTDVNDTYGVDYERYSINNLVRQPGEQFVTIRCPLELNTATTSRMSDLLGPTGAGIYTIFLTSRYTYSIDSSVPVTLMFPQRTSTSGAGLVVNTPVVDVKAACKNTNPYCTGSPNGENSHCYCFYKQESSTTLGLCQWTWGTGKNDNAAAAVDGAGCGSTTVPAGCAAGISCTGNNCRCIYPVDGGSQDCTWNVPTPSNSLNCARYERER